MSDEERKKRAAKLRERIAKLRLPKENDSPDMKPGESPKEYIERREREIARGRKRKPGN